MSNLTDRQKLVLVKLQRSRAGVQSFAAVWAQPPGAWPGTVSAERQADDALPAGVGFEEALETVAAAGLVPHFHPDRTKP